ncbi:hypothetical protein NKI50_12660 [Mesorhizobium sp. M0563]|uniref:hypothetical protein n=1 Tax=Mesorhizobium sp. M0563 TaxID=2956959 RepID=UPI00333659FC
MIKLDSLSRWNRLEKGAVLTLPGDAERRIRLNVNSPGIARLFLVTGDGEPVFLAAPERRDVVEFAHGGNVSITTEDNDVFVYTAENEPTFSIIENAEVFTQIAERAARNPDMEHLLYLQQINMERRFAQLANDMESRTRDAYDAGKATVVKSDAPGAAANSPLELEPEQDSDDLPPGNTPE